MRFRTSVVQCALWFTLAACHRGPNHAASAPVPQRNFWYDADVICTDSSPRWLPASRASDLIAGPGTMDWSDRRWAYWARRVPGGWAGGPYYPWPSAIDAPLTILLRDTTQREAALAALDTLLPPHARRSPTAPVPIAARQARWDLAELYDWKDFIVSNFGSAKGVSSSMWGLGPDRLTIGIKDLESVPPTIRWLHELDVPCRLVMVEVVGTVSTLPAWRTLSVPEKKSSPLNPRPPY